MSKLVLDGTDLYASTLAVTDANQVRRKGWDFGGGDTYCYVYKDGGPFGGGRLFCNEAYGNRYFSHAITASSHIGFAAWWKRSGTYTDGHLMQFRRSGADQVGVFLTAANKWQVLRGDWGTGTVVATSTLASVTNTWEHIEMQIKFHNTAGKVEIRRNGTTGFLHESTGLDTIATSTKCDAFWLGGGAYCQWANVVVYDLSTASPPSDWIGVHDIGTYMVNADHSTAIAWTPLSTGDNYLQLDENPTDYDTSYVSSTSTGAVDLYGVANISTAATVIGVQPFAYVRKDAAGTKQFVIGMESSSTRGVAAAVSFSTSYQYAMHWLTDYPGSTGFTPEQVNAGWLRCEIE